MFLSAVQCLKIYQCSVAQMKNFSSEIEFNIYINLEVLKFL